MKNWFKNDKYEYEEKIKEIEEKIDKKINTINKIREFYLEYDITEDETLIVNKNCDLEKMIFSKKTKAIYLNHYEKSLDNIIWPNTLEVLIIHAIHSPSINCEWPESLKKIIIIQRDLEEKYSSRSSGGGSSFGGGLMKLVAYGGQDILDNYYARTFKTPKYWNDNVILYFTNLSDYILPNNLKYLEVEHIEYNFKHLPPILEKLTLKDYIPSNILNKLKMPFGVDIIRDY